MKPDKDMSLDFYGVVHRLRDLKTVNERGVAILCSRIGITLGDKPHTLQEVGKKFDISRERVRQVEGKALRMFRHPVRLKGRGYNEVTNREE